MRPFAYADSILVARDTLKPLSSKVWAEFQEQCRCGQSGVSKCISIAEAKILRDPTIMKYLPSGSANLYKLSRVPLKALKALPKSTEVISATQFEAKKVLNPGMSVTQINSLIPTEKPRPTLHRETTGDETYVGNPPVMQKAGLAEGESDELATQKKIASKPNVNAGTEEFLELSITRPPCTKKVKAEITKALTTMLHKLAGDYPVLADCQWSVTADLWFRKKK